MLIKRDAETGAYTVRVGTLTAQAVPQGEAYIVALDPPEGFRSHYLAKVEPWGQMWRVVQLGARLGEEELHDGVEDAIHYAAQALQRDMANERGKGS